MQAQQVNGQPLAIRLHPTIQTKDHAEAYLDEAKTEQTPYQQIEKDLLGAAVKREDVE
jgi:hypothetical protein